MPTESAFDLAARRLLPPLALVAALLAPGAARAAGASDDTCTLAAMPAADALVRVPFDVIDGRIYVQVRVDGRGPYRFAVDTGASGLARADASLVAALDLPVRGTASTSDGVQDATVDTTHLASLELGGLVRHDFDVITRDYRSRKSPESAFSGILAREFFADGLLVLDYPRRTLSFSRARGLSPDATNALAYERAFRVPVAIGDVQVQGNLDTGANVNFVLPRTLYERVSAGPLLAAAPGQLTNGAVAADRATVHGPFRIGGVSIADVEVRVSDRYPELLVGAHALQDHVLLIDQRSQRVAVCP
ncbi:aspartyl protease family protein [Lysobacter yangpyeongensis]|uniref:Aspartyl protease family protein n=1 Tax=Lysobacter yangpyeongensis TaxID=346182 RepID=A0ABW0SNJ1_9GAMM